MSEELTRAFTRSVAEGKARLERSFSALLATGAVGGLDVSVGVLGLLVVQQQTGSRLLAALAFPIGFIALTLAGSELFTENFLVPVTATAAKRAPWRLLPRLWAGTLAANLAAGWLAMGLVMAAFPELRQTAVEVALHPAQAGINGSFFANAVLGGLAITLMTWMERSTEAVSGRLAAAIATAFLLAAAPMLHAIVISLEMFAALHAGAPFGYLDWLGTVSFVTLGNMIGGMVLVTGLRLVQVGRDEVSKERDRPPDEVGAPAGPEQGTPAPGREPVRI